MSSKGRLRIDCTSELDNKPVKEVTVRIYTENNEITPFEVLTTNDEGQTVEIELETPDIEYSQELTTVKPYTNYVIEALKEGYETVFINGVEVLPEVVAIQNILLTPVVSNNTAETYVIPEHTLYGTYPPKIAENEVKDISQTGEIVLSRVVIPEYIVVHDGPPNDSLANNYYVKYKDYIKNVASNEIYATWPQATLLANVLAIMSFTLNRVYTEWYRSKGYNFTITSSTAYDQKWVNGKNIYNTISTVVDYVFSNYLSKPGVVQPLFTQYCDGKRVTCPNWMSQWGSKKLGDQGYSAIEIIRYYYGESLYINTAEEISGVPSSYVGYVLTVGSSGQKVRQLQAQLNTISNSYPLIPKIAVDGVYGTRTANAVRIFQKIFDLPQTGDADFATWYKVSEIYVGVSKIAEIF